MRILIVDDLHPYLTERLCESGFICDYRPDISLSETETIISNYDGIVIRSKFKLSRNLLAKAPELKFIARAGSGLENIDIGYAQSAGIKCINSPEANRDAVGEHAIGMLLSLLNNICKSNKEIRQGIWDRNGNWGESLRSKTVGIIGYGHTGSSFAEKLKGFSPNVIAYDKYKSGYTGLFCRETDMQEIFREADILSLHIPLSSETLGMVNEEYLRSFKKDIIIINTSRGKIIRTEDLVAAIKTGKVKSACLDVLEIENTSFEKLNQDDKPDYYDYLINSNKVILTPHIAGWTDESYYLHSKILANKILDFSPKFGSNSSISRD